MGSEFDIQPAHRHSIRNRREVLASEVCACFYCLALFEPGKVVSWVADGPSESDETALCPHCSVDSVLGSASGIPLTAEFLCRMKQHWFGEYAGGPVS
jgi:hypothetical protein